MDDGRQERPRYLADRACLRLSLAHRPNSSGRAPLPVSELDQRPSRLAWIVKLGEGMFLNPLAQYQVSISALQLTGPPRHDDKRMRMIRGWDHLSCTCIKAVYLPGSKGCAARVSKCDKSGCAMLIQRAITHIVSFLGGYKRSLVMKCADGAGGNFRRLALTSVMRTGSPNRKPYSALSKDRWLPISCLTAHGRQTLRCTKVCS